MKKFRGFKLGRRLIRVSRWIIRKTRYRIGYRLLGETENESICKPRKPIANLLKWGRRLTTGARSLSSPRPWSGYMQIGSEPYKKEAAVPKGHLAVYVGQEDGGFHRVLVPVIYFNHPLFGELLREAEKEYGFQHPGGITIPCRYTEFEKVQTRIAAGSGCGSRGLTLRRSHSRY